ncbi:MAG: carbamoyltransferase HypF, partial [Bacteroidota bacterium]
MKSWQIRFKGIVQGVGFRPFVYKLAKTHHLLGEVSNGPAGVLIVFNAHEETAQTFYEELIKGAPRLSYISFQELLQVPSRTFSNFQIVASDREGERDLLFTPDFGICETCREEIAEKSNRRYSYTFTTCTLCGPRYSIIKDLPYDRELTAMQRFEMCESCQQEYDLPTDRRYYSQSNSCSNCGVSLSLWDSSGKLSLSSEKDKLAYVVEAWKQGKIIALKGIGGYLLSCDVTQSSVIQRLRDKKYRPAKPFALMYPSWMDLEGYDFSLEEKTEMLGAVSPILLLNKSLAYNLPEEIAPGLDAVGIMLPYTPLYQILLSKFQKPIVATSANISNSPIIYESDKIEELLELADLVLDNDRDILIPQDDSVIRYSKFFKQRIIIRRSRGLAPTFFHKEEELATSYLACGTDMKSSIALLHRGKYYLSQYLGDLGHFDTETSFHKVFKHFEFILKPNIQHIFHDLHPSYASSRIAEDLADTYQLPHTAFQHHKAHFAAIMGEHELQKSEDAVLGVIWDGTGYGEDGNIWGGEFFEFRRKKIKRISHLSYYSSFGGDKFAKEPRMALFSLLANQKEVDKKFT